MPATNQEFWAKKFSRTLKRDQEVHQELKHAGWVIAVIWECQIESGIDRVIETLTELAEPSGAKAQAEDSDERLSMMQDLS